MTERRNRRTGEAFLGCTRFPDCRGTRPLAPSVRLGGGKPSSARPIRYRLSLGGRPKGFADYAELLVARIVGRNLNKREGCLVQGLAIIAFFLLMYWFVASGLLFVITTKIAEWYAHQITLPGLPTPTPMPTT
jgi:ssDNA-binding Zn-finger/Zn-ribbon topoisomerase 1